MQVFSDQRVIQTTLLHNYNTSNSEEREQRDRRTAFTVRNTLVSQIKTLKIKCLQYLFIFFLMYQYGYNSDKDR